MGIGNSKDKEDLGIELNDLDMEVDTWRERNIRFGNSKAKEKK